MRDRDMDTFVRAHPQLRDEVAKWRAGHPDGTLRDAVTGLDLWDIPDDPDIQRIIWFELKALGDPAAMVGFQAMRAASRRTRCR